MGKTKGTVVLSAVKLLRSQTEAARRLLPVALHHYLSERIVVASWYPEEHLYELIVAGAALLPNQSGVFEMMGATTCREHVEGLYADHLKRDPQMRARILWRAQHDSGDFALTQSTPNSVTYELTGWDHASPKYCRVVGGYFTELHRLTGAAAPSYTHPTCKSAGADRCVYVVSWR